MNKLLSYEEFLNEEAINENFFAKAAIVIAMATSALGTNAQSTHFSDNKSIEYKIEASEIHQDFEESIKVFDEMNQWLKGNFNGKETWTIKDFLISKNGAKVNVSIERSKSADGYNLFVISCNQKDKHSESTDNILKKNEGSKILMSETVNIKNVEYSCHLIGIKIPVVGLEKPSDNKSVDKTNETGPLIDKKAYDAIHDFETTKGIIKKENGKYVAAGFSKDYNVHQKDDIIKDHIKNSIGLKTWNKIPMKFRMQIFSYMFNSDSDDKDKFRWLAGLAQSLDSSKFSDRKEIMNNESTRQKAINYIQTLEKKDFEDAYDSYLKVLKQQYSTISTKNGDEYDQAAKKLSWLVRPTELDASY